MADAAVAKSAAALAAFVADLTATAAKYAAITADMRCAAIFKTALDRKRAAAAEAGHAGAPHEATDTLARVALAQLVAATTTTDARPPPRSPPRSVPIVSQLVAALAVAPAGPPALVAG
jgi:hypothetical protein